MRPFGKADSKMFLTETQLPHSLIVGYLPPKGSIKERDVNVTERSELVEAFDPGGAKFLRTPLKFGVARPDVVSVNTQVEMVGNLDLMQDPEVESRVWHKSFDLLIKLLGNCGVESQVTKLGDVVYNAKGSCGNPFSNWFKDKGEFVRLDGLDIYYEPYRRDAHVLNLVPLGVGRGKYEILPLDKIQGKNVRLFIFFHVCHFFYSAQDNQHFNKLLYGVPYLNAVGSVFQMGGFDRLIRRLERIPGSTFFEADVRKWDKHILARLLWLCCEIRIATYHGDDAEQYSQRMRWQYRVEIYKYLLLPNGQVLLQFGSQASGRVNTTSDNTLIHMFIFICYIIESLDHNGTMRLIDVQNILEALIYSDDTLGAISKPFNFLCNFETRSEFYRKFRLSLKAEDDKVQLTPVGLKFLGAKVILRHGHYVPQYDVERLRAGVNLKKGQELTASQHYAKTLAIYLLSIFVEEEWFKKNLHQLLVFCHMKAKGKIDIQPLNMDEDLLGFLGYAGEMEILDVPSEREVINFWLGLENSIRVVPLSNCTQSEREEESSLIVTAEKLKVGRQTLWLWLFNPTFDHLPAE